MAIPVLYYNLSVLEHGVLTPARFSGASSTGLPLTLPRFKDLRKKLVMAEVSTDFGLLLEVGATMLKTH